MSALLTHSQRILLDSVTHQSVQLMHDHIAKAKVESLSLTLTTGEKIECGPEAAQFIQSVITGAAAGKLTIDKEPEWVSTTVAADLLGVTRPTLRKWIRSGKISATNVRSHQKLRLEDVTRLRDERHAERVTAFENLRQFEEEFLPVQN